MTANKVRTSAARPALAVAAATLLGVLGIAACQESLPTATRDDLVPEGTTVEVNLPFGDFGGSARVFGGYGRASDLGGGFVARSFGESEQGEGLTAATLARFGSYPGFASVEDTTGTTRPDSSLTFLSGRIVAQFNVDGSVTEGPVELWAHALAEPWDQVSASWDLAIDTLNHKVPWTESGGGAVAEIGSAIWDPSEGDSVSFAVDSALVAAWADSADLAKGVRLTTSAAGTRLQLRSARLWLETLPSINPDTIIHVQAVTEGTTFIYDPLPVPPESGLRVGGAPAWRSVLDVGVPEVLNDIPSLCAAVDCPVTINEGHVSYAGLVLTSSATATAFAPSDTLALDLRMVLAPDFLPKSPLGPPMVGIGGTLLVPEWFGPSAGHEVEIPVTSLVRDVLRGETVSGGPVTGTVALLSAFEPLSLEYASFEGPDSPGQPRLRMILSFPPPAEG